MPNHVRPSGRRAAVVLTVLALAAGACTGSDGPTANLDPAPPPPPASGPDELVMGHEFNASSTRIVNPSAQTGGTLRLGAFADANSWEPARTYYAWVNDVQRLYVRTLMGFAPDPIRAATVVPDLAEAPGEPNRNFTKFTYTLRDGITYEDGDRVTSGDIKHAIERLYQPGVLVADQTVTLRCLLAECDERNLPLYLGPRSGHLSSIDTPDDRTIVFTLRESYATFDYLMALSSTAPVPPSKDTSAAYHKRKLATGPFRIASYQPKRQIKFVRNQRWNPDTDPIRKPLLDEVVIEFIPDLNELDELLIAGAIDARADTGLQPAFQTEVLADPELRKQVDTPLDGGVRYLALSRSVAPLDNIHCRRAIAYAVDKQSFQEASGGPAAGIPAGALTPHGLPGYDPEANRLPNGADFTGDLEQARAELDACGRPDGFAVNMSYLDQDPEPDRARAVKDSLARVGITVTLKKGDRATYFTTIVGSPATIRRDRLGVASAGRSSQLPTTAGFWREFAHGDSIQAIANPNIAALDNPAINRLIDRSLTAGPDQWTAIGRQAEEAVMDQAVYIPMLHSAKAYWRSPRMTNVYSTDFVGLYDWVNAGVSDSE
ncbi:MAG: ABC transporter substrate-binding protein [Sporichthyaceae bacterium]|nr:ABC transporter substrate-binding protein [Sporichthyaceae bacterium]